MTIQEYEAKLEHIITEYTKAYDDGDLTAGGWVILELGKLRDEWTADVIGNDMAISMGTTATSPNRNLPGNPGNEHMFAFEDGFNRRGTEARQRAGLPEK